MAPFPSPTAAWHDKAYPEISPSRPELSAHGKNILITGGGTGIGAETAHRFAQAGAARIALLGRREQPLLDTKISIQRDFPGVEVFTAPTNITRQSEVDAAFSQFLGPEGRIHVLVSNAGMIGPMVPVANAPGDQALDAIQQNLHGAWWVAQAFLRCAAPDAAVIETSSSAAHVNFGPGLAPYSVAKMAVFRLWDAVGFENPGLRVYHVQPGVVDTAMNREAGGIEALGFEDHVDLPASFYVWLASPEADFLKGKYLWANWDVSELKRNAEKIQSTPRLSIQLGGWPFADDSWGLKSESDNV
ncbi:NAD(P)-binding protein [Aspergillus japonicus CBS 114.51]|uniref:NAD(P)-binding protein n=2 Tax=Aspergillus TaxID=5052 RepID=A0A2V5GSD7_ASPV1|nr:NAD(P)-binding protein [Aspergillus japonicus CBS 114.51]PYI14155.1 NAD(P)-binding protein [Aspergillus violaceofuscus CBS 115571]RAH80320.1 NAD(P)-binding protein [Aspergillus japonicus CBS 114.51]